MTYRRRDMGLYALASMIWRTIRLSWFGLYGVRAMLLAFIAGAAVAWGLWA
jgi:hypothetical protein